MLKKTALLLLAVLSTAGLNAQKSVKWGEKVKSEGRLNYIIPVKGSEFYTRRTTGGMMGISGGPKLSYHKNFEVSATGKIELKVEGGKGGIEAVHYIGGKLLVFVSDIKEGGNNIFMQEYSSSIETKGSAKKIASYTFEKGKTKGSFDVISSRNKEFFAVLWSIPGKKDAQDSYGYKVFDGELNEVSTGDYELPFDAQLSTINQYHLSNTGDFFISVDEYEKGEKKLFKSFTNYKATHIYQITPDGIEEFEVGLGNKRIVAMDMNSDNNHIFTLVGTYGERGQGGIKGLFHVRVDFDKKEILSEGFEEFGKDFITQDWSDKQKEKAEKKEKKGKGEPAFFNYTMRQTEVLKDGSVIGSMEQYYVVVTTYTDPKTGATRTTYHYYYNDIVAFKINTAGEFEWLQKINKFQHSTNDGGYFSSYSRFVNDGKLCFIFNDNDQNYNESGKFVGREKGGVYGAAYTKKKNVVAIVDMDLETGEYTRKTFFDRAEVMAIAVPKMFEVDYQENTLLLYTTFWGKERFGLMDIND